MPRCRAAPACSCPPCPPVVPHTLFIISRLQLPSVSAVPGAAASESLSQAEAFTAAAATAALPTLAATVTGHGTCNGVRGSCSRLQLASPAAWHPAGADTTASNAHANATTPSFTATALQLPCVARFSLPTTLLVWETYVRASPERVEHLTKRLRLGDGGCP